MNLSTFLISFSWSKYDLQRTLEIGEIAYLKLIWGQYGFEVKVFQEIFDSATRNYSKVTYNNLMEELDENQNTKI